MQSYLEKSAEFANVSASEGWRPDQNLDQLMLCLKSFKFSISFSNMFADMEATISVFDLGKAKTFEARANGHSEADAGFKAFCDLIDMMT